MCKCQFTVSGSTEYHPFADKRNTGNWPLPLLWTRSRWFHHDDQSHETKQTMFCKDMWAQKYLLPEPVDNLIVPVLFARLRWMHSSLQDKDTICMVTVSSTNTGGQVTENLGNSRNLSQGILLIKLSHNLSVKWLQQQDPKISLLPEMILGYS